MGDFKLVQRYIRKGEGEYFRVRTVTTKNGDVCTITMYKPALEVLGTKPGGTVGVAYDNDDRRLAIFRYDGEYAYKVHPYGSTTKKREGFVSFYLPKPGLDIPVYQRSFVFNSRDVKSKQDVINDTGKALVMELPDPKTIKTGK